MWRFDNERINLQRYDTFFEELVCYFSTGCVIVVFVFEDVIDGLKLMSFLSQMAYMKLSTEAQVALSNDPLRLHECLHWSPDGCPPLAHGAMASFGACCRR